VFAQLFQYFLMFAREATVSTRSLIFEAKYIQYRYAERLIFIVMLNAVALEYPTRTPIVKRNVFHSIYQMRIKRLAGMRGTNSLAYVGFASMTKERKSFITSTTDCPNW
jgi:hypothetical protein